jgi:hypothetical protein
VLTWAIFNLTILVFAEFLPQLVSIFIIDSPITLLAISMSPTLLGYVKWLLVELETGPQFVEVLFLWAFALVVFKLGTIFFGFDMGNVSHPFRLHHHVSIAPHPVVQTANGLMLLDVRAPIASQSSLDVRAIEIVHTDFTLIQFNSNLFYMIPTTIYTAVVLHTLLPRVALLALYLVFLYAVWHWPRHCVYETPTAFITSQLLKTSGETPKAVRMFANTTDYVLNVDGSQLFNYVHSAAWYGEALQKDPFTLATRDSGLVWSRVD